MKTGIKHTSMTDIKSNLSQPHLPRPIVAKFGGSSVADADQVRKIAAIVRADPRRRFVVVSAPGKRNDQDKKITDLLYLCHSLGEQGIAAAARRSPLSKSGIWASRRS